MWPFDSIRWLERTLVLSGGTRGYAAAQVVASATDQEEAMEIIDRARLEFAILYELASEGNIANIRERVNDWLPVENDAREALLRRARLWLDPASPVGRSVGAPAHLAGAVVVDHVRATAGGVDYLILDRSHPTERGPIAVGLDYVELRG